MDTSAAATRHQIAAVALVRDGRILLGHRHPERDAYPDCWDLVGGHIEAGETAEEAARRECSEEIGVEVGPLRALAIANTDPSLDIHSFVATDWAGEPKNMAPEEHDDLRWFHRDELPDLVLADEAMLPGLLRATGA